MNLLNLLGKHESYTNITLQPLLIVFGGESNSGGIANNSSATTLELGPRNLKILNNSTLTSFDSLHIGNNNQVGHAGLEFAFNTGHGFELQLANRYDEGAFGQRQVFLCKAGQGGTVIANWVDGVLYNSIDAYSLFIARVEAAISLIQNQTQQTPIVIMFWSQGINDGGNNVPSWKTKTKSLFASFRQDLGIILPIYSTQFQGMGFNNTDTAIAEIENEISNYKAINTAGAERIDVVAGPNIHWGYLGMKQVTNSIINALLIDL
jgi:hypothetical protein